MRGPGSIPIKGNTGSLDFIQHSKALGTIIGIIANSILPVKHLIGIFVTTFAILTVEKLK